MNAIRQRAPLEGAAQTARRINRTPGWFYANRDRLIAHEKFPRPVAGTKKWDPRAVEFWLASQLPEGHPDRPKPQTDLAAASTELKARLGAAAGT